MQRPHFWLNRSREEYLRSTTGGSGLQYRSRTGLPWLANIPANVVAFNGPVNLDWMMTGPQADFWPSRVFTGQFYSENTPMRMVAVALTLMVTLVAVAAAALAALKV